MDVEDVHDNIYIEGYYSGIENLGYQITKKIIDLHIIIYI